MMNFLLCALKKNRVSNRVVVVRDGAEALDFLFYTGGYANRDPQDMPQVILLDLQLPKVDGLVVLQRLRADKRTKLILVIILTSSTAGQDLMIGYKHGAIYFIRKPVDFVPLVEVIGHVGLYWLLLNGLPPPPGKEIPYFMKC